MKKLFCIGLISLAFTICSRATAQEAPVIINPETGAVVNLTRAYWDANVDIANKRMQCDYFSIDDESGAFEKTTVDAVPPLTFSSLRHTRNTQYSHQPLPNGVNQTNVALVILSEMFGGTRRDIARGSVWGVTDGSYQGLAPLSTSEFVEVVAFNASTDNAVRVWFTENLTTSLPSFSVCYDLDGTPLLPTGTAGSGNTQLVDLPDFTFDYPVASDSIPDVTNLRTGEQVLFTRGRWSYNKDIGGRSFGCRTFNWNSSSQFYQESPINSFTSATLTSESYGYYNGGDSFIRSLDADRDDVLELVDMDINTVFLPGGSGPLEIFNEPSPGLNPSFSFGYRIWKSSTEFEECLVSPNISGIEAANGADILGLTDLPFGPTEILPLIAVENAPVMADNTAPLVVTENCDYIDSDDFDGYGFDPITMLSCPPLDNDNSDDETTDTANNIQDASSNESADVVQTNPTLVDNAPNDSTVSSDDNTTVQNTNDIQTNTDSTGNLSDDSTGNSNDATTAENENTVVEDEMVVSNTQTDSAGTDLGSSDETASPSSGGGSFWLPILMFALAIRRPMRALQKQY